LATFALLLGLRLPAAEGAPFSDSFQSELERAAPEDLLSGILMIDPPHPVADLLEEARAEGLRSRWRVHEHVLAEAQRLARRSQASLLDALGAWENTGAVARFRPYWITNAVAVTARPEVFRSLAGRADIRLIERDAPVELRGIATEAGGLEGANHAHDAIHLEGAWGFGVTGAGRLVCTFDTGVDGLHEALAPRWRGADPEVPWYHAWFDPTDHTEFPVESSSGHGTSVMGVLVGDPPDAAPFGVAPGASWIAGKIRFSSGGASTVEEILSLFEWAADPDSNLSTIDDVPDVINNSWGTSEGCAETYWDAIDLVEAAGIVNIIAVANEGLGGVRSPESRAETPYQNFGVGSVNTKGGEPVIDPDSGRGPSPCDGVSIKPELTAPGVGIWTSFPSDNYGLAFGTSVAAPHVSATVALLREIDPDLDVNAIKDILLTTARDRGVPGEDNDYGWGVLNVAAAVQTVLARGNALPRPTYASASWAGGDSVRVSWNAPISAMPSSEVITYGIYRAPIGESFPDEPTAVVPASDRSFLDIGVPAGEFLYVVSAEYATGESGPSRFARVTVGRRAATPEAAGGTRFVSLILAANRFSPSTRLRVPVDGNGPVRITLHDAGGRMVREFETHAGADLPARVSFDGTIAHGRALAAGVYFVRVHHGGRQSFERLLLLR